MGHSQLEGIMPFLIPILIFDKLHRVGRMGHRCLRERAEAPCECSDTNGIA